MLSSPRFECERNSDGNDPVDEDIAKSLRLRRPIVIQPPVQRSNADRQSKLQLFDSLAAAVAATVDDWL